ncbi:beta-N-acetylhexosaminidase [Formosa sp. PL04]|uniref:beta-N-acetylhexosaminidase n=1 Tax=Formosa sp. PL04 TaxID=3081755 RepID=UPI002980F96C|nr:family 20 glycosylhydrolase [Formosa sp. PL04]MDW5290008.1 family 20 glycosylhydrolase [Formosa sp. PL04]
MKKIILLIIIINVTSQLSYAQDALANTYDLMPWPKNIQGTEQMLPITENLTISINGPSQERVRFVATSFLRRLSGRTGVFINSGFPTSAKDNTNATIKISYKNEGTLTNDNDESYQLNVTNSGATITAQTDIGALRGIETLLQLTNSNATNFYFQGAEISDAPRFVWRGLMIDVSRHFHPVNVIKRNLDGMASVKMNVFHWHLIDDQGIRIESKIYPQLTALASDGLFYTQEQIKEVVVYASKLGIRVIPEIDVPGHASAILTAFPELGSKPGATYTIERNSGIFDPTLDPTNEETYVFLYNLFTEIAPLFPDPYFHIGGDENEGKHWDENENIQEFKEANNLKTNHDLQTYFNIKLEKILNKSGKKLVGWDEIMTPTMPTTAVIHSWRSENEGLPKGGSLIEAAKQGYNTILSNGFYIDRMQSVVGHYQNEPIGDIELTTDEQARILGGEATMWSELVTSETLDSRIWPRTAAIAERLWSPKSVNNVDNMLKRLAVVNFRLEELGLTHITNKTVILRNLTNNQDISSLETLMNICEPLKIYTRNKDGVEYKTFSPFTLFADACTVDAKDAMTFNRLVKNYVSSPSENTKTEIISYLKIWSKNYEAFSKLNKTPILNSLEPISKNLSEAATIILQKANNKPLSNSAKEQLKNNLKVLKQDHVDVEIAIVDALEIISKHI